MIDHGAGVFTAYHHLSRIDVAQGQFVNQGDNIGAVGMTGLATGPHLHWELVVGGVEREPGVVDGPGCGSIGVRSHRRCQSAARQVARNSPSLSSSNRDANRPMK